MQNNQQGHILDGNTSGETRIVATHLICACLLFRHGSSVVPILATSIHILAGTNWYVFIYKTVPINNILYFFNIHDSVIDIWCLWNLQIATSVGFVVILHIILYIYAELTLGRHPSQEKLLSLWFLGDLCIHLFRVALYVLCRSQFKFIYTGLGCGRG